MAPILVCTLEQSRVPWLPQFVRHYRAQGLKEFRISVQCEVGDRRRAEAARRLAIDLLRPFGISVVDILERDFDAMALREHHDSIQESCRSPWFVWADIDEFQVYPAPLPRLIRGWEKSGVQVCGGRFVDRIARSGELVPFDHTRPIWGQFPVGAPVTRDIVGGQINKVVCSHRSVRVKHANHDPVKGQVLRWAEERIGVFHFKWDSTVAQRLQVRTTESWKQRCPWWVQTAKLFAVLESNGGRIPVERLPTFDFRDDLFADAWHPYNINTSYLEWDLGGRPRLWSD